MKGVQRTDESPPDTPMDLQEATVAMACDAQNYYLENMVKSSVDHLTETEV